MKIDMTKYRVDPEMKPVPLENLPVNSLFTRAAGGGILWLKTGDFGDEGWTRVVCLNIGGCEDRDPESLVYHQTHLSISGEVLVDNEKNAFASPKPGVMCNQNFAFMDEDAEEFK